MSPCIWQGHSTDQFQWAHSEGCFLTFPHCTINVDDSEDCLISICPALLHSKVDFDACLSPTHATFVKSILPIMTWFALVLSTIVADTVSIINSGEIPLEIGDMAKIKRANRSSEKIPPVPNFLHTVHGNISFGDSVPLGGYKYCLLLVDQKTRSTWTYGLKSVSGKHLVAAFKQSLIKAGGLLVAAAPTGHQSQNGLAKRAWQILSKMAQEYITDM
eukprot:3378559-Ditylum_brightwellii.AAC.1